MTSQRHSARPSLRLSLCLVAAVAMLAVAAGCSGGTTGNAADGRIAAVAGENFYGDLIARVGGDRVSVTSLLSDPNIDPHTYESSPQNAEAVADARLVVANGFGYDAFMDRLLATSASSNRTAIDVQKLLGLPDGGNPHIWYDPQTMPKVARAVADALEQIEPASKPIFEANLAAYLDSFAPLTSGIAEIKSKYGGAPIACTEPVAGYLTAAMGLQVLTPDGFAKAIENGTDPAPVDVAAQRDLLTGHKVKILLYNSQATSPVTDSIKTLAEQQGIPVVGVSETMPKQSQSFVDWQVGQLSEMETALGQSR
jgi:zinc/manganese transport system substrate-binding protein